jgi:hypothetical protein
MIKANPPGESSNQFMLIGVNLHKLSGLLGLFSSAADEKIERVSA